MKLFHGSDHIIATPQVGIGNPHNDYGLGFYCTASLEMACEWAVGHQTMIKSPRAFDRLSFVRAHEVPIGIWLPKREERDRLARKSYFDVERHKRRSGDIYITHILDERMEPDDARL